MPDTPLPLLIQGSRLLDPVSELDDPAVEDLFLDGGRIAARGAEAVSRAAAVAHRRIDGEGMLAVPGFVDAHYHSHDVLLRGLFEQWPLDVWSLHSFPSYYPPRSADEVALRTALGAAECLLGGITTVQDMVTIVGPNRAHVDAVSAAYAEAGLRVCLALQIGDRPTIDTMPFWREQLPAGIAQRFAAPISPGAMQELVLAAMDAGARDGLSWALAPSTPERCSEELLGWVRDASAQRGLRVFTHVYEARAQAVLARLRHQRDGGSMIALLDRVGLLNERLTVAHGIWIAPHEIERMAAAGASLASNPVANLKLLDGVAPVHSYIEAGVNVGLGTDNCSCSDAHNIFQAMKMFAIFLAYQDGDGEQRAARRAFRAATLGSARALGLEGEVGTLEVGRRADVVLIDTRNPAYRPLHSAVRQLVYGESGRNVHTVVAGGRVVVEGGRLVSLDEEALYRRADAARAAVQADHAALRDSHRDVLGHLWRIRRLVEDFPLDIDRLRLN
ncbi:amidohydrolase family protein [Pigmentiphaga soli]|uniref:Amidohydrolase family protein n=1 Tax=Pigmentiphaga soli TaxID=1007095 RepID=A0ABP8GPM2_9BURK